MVAHVLAALAWLGALPGLALALHGASPATAWLMARRFSWLGGVCVLVLVASALVQASLVGSLPALLGTPYGQVVAVKLLLLLALLGLAGANLRAAIRPPRQAGDAVRGLRRRVWIETVLGGVVLGAAAYLVQLAPGAHQQAEWPFAWRPSIVVLAEPELRDEVAAALVALLVAARLGGCACLRRPLWLPALAAPGPLRALAGEAANLMAPHLWDHSDGASYSWLADGIEDGGGHRVMPGFSHMLDDDAVWGLIDFIRARDAGLRIGELDPGAVESQIRALGLRQRFVSGDRHVHPK